MRLRRATANGVHNLPRRRARGSAASRGFTALLRSLSKADLDRLTGARWERGAFADLDQTSTVCVTDRERPFARRLDSAEEDTAA